MLQERAEVIKAFLVLQATPCNGRISVKCPADPGKHVMPHSMEKDKKEQQ